MEQAIKIAIENGWHQNWKDVEVDSVFVRFTSGEFDVRTSWMIERLLLDPLFWQALIPENQWTKLSQLEIDKWKTYSTGDRAWQYHWHRFIDHLAEGKDIESFFTNLLN